MELEVVDTFKCSAGVVYDIVEEFVNKDYLVDIEHFICLSEKHERKCFTIKEDGYVHNVMCSVTVKKLKE